MDPSTIFISYSHRDQVWVRDWLAPRLEAAGLKVLIDTRDFTVGAAELDNIERAVEASRWTLLVLTPTGSPASGRASNRCCCKPATRPGCRGGSCR